MKLHVLISAILIVNIEQICGAIFGQPAVPAAVASEPGPKGVYVGCYDAWQKNTLQYSASLFIKGNNLELCSANCRQSEGQPSPFALLKGKYCACLNWNKFRNERLDDSACKIKCPGDEQSMCGGHHAFSVYCLGSAESDCSRDENENPVLQVKAEVKEVLTVTPAVAEVAYPCVSCNASLSSCIASSIQPWYDYVPGNTPRLCAEYCGRPVSYHHFGTELARAPTKYAFAGWDSRITSSGRTEIAICKCSDSVLDNFEEVDPEVCSKRCTEDDERHDDDDVCGGPDKGVFSVYHSHAGGTTRF